MEKGLKIVRRKNTLVITGDIGSNLEWKQQSISIRQDLNDESIVTVTFKVPTKKLLDIQVMED